MNCIFVHGLGLSSIIWEPLIPLVKNPCLTLDVPGHGNSQNNCFSWQSLFNEIESRITSDSQDVTLVLHSFSSCLLPELINTHLSFKYIVLVEGLIHSDDAIHTRSMNSFTSDAFDLWYRRFLKVTNMALKHQLVTAHPKKSIDLWSNAFQEVLPEALQQYGNLCLKRLNDPCLYEALVKLSSSLVYLKGDRSKLSKTNSSILSELSVNTLCVPNCSHFPMLDNPVHTSDILNSLSNS